MERWSSCGDECAEDCAVIHWNINLKMVKMVGEVQEGGDIGVPMADSCWYVAESNITL